ncbi:MAG TPA: threonine synthase [Anaerolineales bacterium]|nr:threonine synthase [Anaerolineales bacterium]
MTAFLGYRCHRCGRDYPPADVFYTCPDDGANLDVRLDLERIRATTSPQAIAASREPSIWRYLPLLPVGTPGHVGTPLWAVGWTPLFTPRRLAATLGLTQLWMKDDGRNPTASFKDRASAVVVARAQEIGAGTVVTASTGNAGAALAGMAAAAGQPAVILAPRTAPPAKVAQLLIFGATVLLVEGTYDQAFDLTIEAAAALGWYCRNTGYNPFTAEGKKTAAFEICEQLGVAARAKDRSGPSPLPWIPPDVVFVSVGDGNIISGLFKGFCDLLELEWIPRMPRLVGIQAEGSAAVYQAFTAGASEISSVRAETIADSISVDLPRDGLRALRAVRESGGTLLTVGDRAILNAIAELGRVEGVFAEPAAATAYAGLVEAVHRRLVDPEERVVVMLTGSGLKDVRAAMQAAGEATVIEPSLAALRRALPPGRTA